MKKGLEGILDKLDNRDWLQKSFDKVFERKKCKPKIIDYFYASWAGECPRLIQYIMKGMIHDDIDPQSQRRLDNGNYVHMRYGDYFESIGMLRSREPAFKLDMDGVFVSGRGDLIVFNEDKLEFLIEMKSINANGFKNIIHIYRENDFLQWNLCSKALKILTGIILYENKDSQELKYHFVNFDNDKYMQTINKFRKIDECNQQGIFISKPECINKFCNAKSFCS